MPSIFNRLFLIILCLCSFLLLNCSKKEATGPSITPCAADAKLFTESGGLVIIELEEVADITDIGEWQYRNNNPNGFGTTFSGKGYLYFNGNDSFRDGGNSLLEYQIQINTPGTYRFVYASAIAKGDLGSEHNDAWVKFPDADNFFAKKGTSTLYPNDEESIRRTPNPNGSNSRNNGFFKVYNNQLDNWYYEGRTSDNDGHDIFVTFDQAGTFTMQVSGRSNGFAIDRAVLWIEQGELADLNSRTKRKNAFESVASADATCP